MTFCRTQTSRNVFAFTLVEMSVTLVIIVILAGMGTFAFNSIRVATANTKASANVDRVASVQQSLARDWGSYSPYGADIKQVGNDLTFAENGALSTGSDNVSITVGTKGNLGIAIMGSDNTCRWFVVSSLLSNGNKTQVTTNPSSAPCNGRAALASGESSVPYTPGGTIKTS